MKYRFVKPKSRKKSPLAALSPMRLFNGPPPDGALLVCVFGLLVFGWVMVYSASALFAENRYHDQYFFFKRQVLWSVIGLVAFLAAANVPVSFWQKVVKPMYIATIILLVATLFLAPNIAGARRWLRFGGFSLQPSEIAKIAMIFVTADYLDRRQSRLKDLKRGLLPLLGMVGLICGLVLLEKDLGTPVLMCATLFSLLMLAGARWSHFFLMIAVALPLVAAAILRERYRINRLFAYMNPWEDPQGKGYQLVQSLLAMGSGGFFGRGLGESVTKRSSLPDAHTDFVFSVLGEELGLIGTLGCAGLFLFLCMRGLRVAKHAEDAFSRYVAAGVSLMIGFQALINMGVASGLFPTKGMPLPFISFGGSSLVVTLFSVGLLASISRSSSLQR